MFTECSLKVEGKGGPVAKDQVPVTVREVLKEGVAESSHGQAPALRLIEFAFSRASPAFALLDKRLLQPGGVRGLIMRCLNEC